MNAVIEHLYAMRVIPFATLNDSEKAVPLAHALIEGGCDIVSISFRSADAVTAISNVVASVPEMFVGAGSVLSAEDVSAAHLAGASFAMAPGFDPQVVDCAHAAGLPILPGTMTPSNMSRSLVQGCHVQTFFPAEPLGTAVLDAILSAFRHKGVKVVATGGINSDNILNWLSIPDVIACGASWICPAELIDAEDWAEISRRTRETLAKIHG